MANEFVKILESLNNKAIPFQNHTGQDMWIVAGIDYAKSQIDSGVLRVTGPTREVKDSHEDMLLHLATTKENFAGVIIRKHDTSLLGDLADLGLTKQKEIFPQNIPCVIYQFESNVNTNIKQPQYKPTLPKDISWRVAQRIRL